MKAAAPFVLCAMLMSAACGQETRVEDYRDSTTAASEPAAAAPAPTVITITEADARARVEAIGFTHVTALTQNPDGSWVATGVREGQVSRLIVSERGVAQIVCPGDQRCEDQ
jgi:hypothetical protein